MQTRAPPIKHTQYCVSNILPKNILLLLSFKYFLILTSCISYISRYSELHLLNYTMEMLKCEQMVGDTAFLMLFLESAHLKW